MKFKFTTQKYQTEAVESVIKVFDGQPFNKPEEMLEEYLTSFANSPIKLEKSKILENIRRIQNSNHVELSKNIADDLGACSLDIEMETGTGKTYVYIKTMFELNKIYGWSKFIIVVPSIAIREGVKKSFETMQEHFMELYGKKARFFVYDSKNFSEIDNFSHSGGLNVMIINIQAFNARGDARRIRTELDSFGSLKPIDIIKAGRPIIILDEPQKMGGKATQDSLKEFNPLFSLNYSATHKQHHNLIYVLDFVDAQQEKLVKNIKVIGIDVKNLQGTDGYLYLRNIEISHDKPPMARLELEIKYKDSIKRETRLIGVNDDLFSISKNLEQYRGYHVSEINHEKNFIAFTNGIIIHAGEVLGDVSEEYLRRLQIRATIQSHFEKEKDLYNKGIKCLSLFFIDEVAKYRKYNDEGQEINSEYGEIFEQEYDSILNKYLDETPYGQYLKSIKTNKTHAGYFSIDKKGRKTDGSLKRGTDESDDISAYDLILKDKERLLSFENPVRFIFSHSALREGWDNPNVFQICTLKHGGSSATQKRQEVGRGLRLCVNQSGDRMEYSFLEDKFQGVNQLTVIASEGYRNFISDLQKGIVEDLYERPTQATEEYFRNKKINGHEITDKQARDIYKYLLKNDYIDDENYIADKYREDKENNSFAILPESCIEFSKDIHKLIQSIFDKKILDDLIKDGRKPEAKENPLNENFYKKEFQQLWSLINHRYVYTVEFEDSELITNAIKTLDENMFVSKLQYTITTGTQKQIFTSEELKSGESFEVDTTSTEILGNSRNINVKYDLIGRIAKGTDLTRRTVCKILDGIKSETFEKFYNNPEEFITKSIQHIKEQKSTMILEHITYNSLEERYNAEIFTEEKHSDHSNFYISKKNVQKYVFTDGYAKDGKSIERRMAEDLDNSQEVYVYAKLPRGFYIPTPVGKYSPDWAIVFEEGKVKHMFFIAETKGSMNSLNLRSMEKTKIEYAKKLFAGLSNKNIVYHEVDSYENLLNIMENL